MLIRCEEERDREAVATVIESTFARAAEVYLVAALREQVKPIVSLVAEKETAIVGHIMFSPVTLSADPERRIMGLAPLAVAPEQQHKGIGSALVRTGLDHCKQQGFGAVVVLGHASYYPRFGFQPAARFNIRSEFNGREDAFMLLELQYGYLRGVIGTVRYHAIFNDI